jgi:MFS transporter, OFA family, oxalate/formate antiporter
VNRWIRLGAAVVAMMMIANLQYAWTLFVKPLIAATHWKLSDVQWGFTIFIALETWAMPCSGWLVDRIGPRAFLSVAGFMCGVGWASLGHVHTLSSLYLFYGLAGFGAALVYCGSMGIALKWFPDKRGLAAGLISAGFGSGAALFIPIIAHLLKVADYQTAFLYTGIGQGLVIILAGQFLKNPTAPLKIAPATRVRSRSQQVNFTSAEMLKTPHFYLMFAMALAMGIGGLMTTAQVAPMAGTFKISAAALTLSLTLNPLANGGSRLFWGWVSDRVGRERTMFVAFVLQAFFLVGVVTIGRTSDTLFVISLVLVYFTWGEVYSLFPSTCGDFFGARHASSNYSFLYSAKGAASIVGGGLAAMLFEKTGSWDFGFYACAGLALVAAVGSLVLRKMPLPTRAALPVTQPTLAES